MNDIHLRPITTQEDADFLDSLRWMYKDADLEIPKGYMGEGVHTAIAQRGPVIVSSLTMTNAVILDPLINNPNCTPLELQKALIKLEAALSYAARVRGAVDAYIAIPNQLREYMKIVEKTGYQRTVENCTVFRRPLLPDTVDLIGPQRDRLEAEQPVSQPEHFSEG